MDPAAAAAKPAAHAAAGDSPKPASNKPTGFLAYANVELKPRWPSSPSLFKPAPPAAPAPAPAPTASYKECLKNHAAIIGGHALDGCREFMPSPMFAAADPTTLRCAACGCHRSFHRPAPPDPPSSPPAPAPTTPAFFSPMLITKQDSPPPAPAPAPTSPAFFIPPKQGSPPPAPASDPPPRAARKSPIAGAGKKRFRSKFTREQKEKMHEFCKREGWKLQRIEKRAVEEICKEVGVTKEVLRVWINNNKNSLRREEVINGGNGSFEGDKDRLCFGDYGGHFEAVHMGPGNGSSSSSE